MKKIIIFLITFLGINIFSLVNVNAKDFYEGGYIDGIYVTKEKGGTRYYQKARFFNRTSDNHFSYCIEPFAMFNENSSYQSSLNPSNLNNSQKDRIEKIAYFGYQYPGHEDPRWYAVSQFMIWQTADPSGDVYFTDSLDGNRINAYQNEINEINNLINNYNRLPSINKNSDYYVVNGKSLVLTDNNNTLSNYTISGSNARINGNKIIIENIDKEGDYNFVLNSKGNRIGSIPIYFHSDSSQDMMIVGNISINSIPFKVHVKDTSLTLYKVDKDTKKAKPRGDASLSGAIYQLYDKDMNEIDTLEINEDLEAKIDNIDFGKYYLKEIKAGKGYTLDDTLYEFEITHEDTKIELTMENKVIEKTIKLHKSYGDGITTNSESGISFNIFDSHNNLYNTITTDSNGFAKITLPYGIYTFRQVNSTEGYTLTKDFKVKVEDEDEEEKEIDLYDYKIPVPNTSKEKKYLLLIIFSILGFIYVKKSITN